MAQFSVNATRLDPYKNFKFRVTWDSKVVAGVSKVSVLKRTTEVIKHRSGGDPSTSYKCPGRTEYDAITLERGVTHDQDFEQWANKVWNFRAGLGGGGLAQGFPQGHHHRPAQRGRAGRAGLRVYRCWVSEYQALPDLDANANAVAIAKLKLENEGWERDYAVVEPTEPSFVEP